MQSGINLEARETMDEIDAFELLQRNHLVRTLPSTQKRCCTEAVANRDAAMRNAEGMMRDMATIGLSGVRLTGDMEHELQYPTSSATPIESDHAEAFLMAASRRIAVHDHMTSSKTPPTLTSSSATKLGAAATLSSGTLTWSPAGVASSSPWTAGGSAKLRQRLSSSHAKAMPVITDGATSAGTAVKPTLEEVLSAENNTLSAFGAFPLPTLEDLRQPLPDYHSDEAVGRALFSSAGPVEGAPLRTVIHSPGKAPTTPRPTSARVVPSVRQLRVYAAPLYPNIPVAPHLTAVLRWCRNAHELRSNAHLRHLLRIADVTNKEGEQSSELEVGWALSNGSADRHDVFVVGSGRDKSPSPSARNPSAAAEQETRSSAAPRRSLQHIIRHSKYTMNIIREATHGIFEDHLSWYHAIVAVWFEYCQRDLTLPRSTFRIPGCMGNSASAFVAFFETLYESVHLGPNDAEQLYQLLNDDTLEQLSFGKFFLLLYLVHGPERVDPVDTPHSDTIPLKEKTRSKDELVALRKKRLSLVGSDNPLGNTLFAPTIIPSDRAAQIEGRRRASAPPFSSSFPSRFPSIAELWMSLAGALLLKKCRTVNVFHVESVVTTVLSIILTGVESTAATRPAIHAEKVKRIEAQLRDDLRKFQDIIGSKVEVMQEEALNVLRQHTKLLGPWLTSTCAHDAQEELNAIVDCVLQTMAEEEKVEQQLAASMKAQAAAAPPQRKKRGGAPTRSNSLLLPPKRKLSMGDLGRGGGMRSATPQ